MDEQICHLQRNSRNGTVFMIRLLYKTNEQRLFIRKSGHYYSSVSRKRSSSLIKYITQVWRCHYSKPWDCKQMLKLSSTSVTTETTHVNRSSQPHCVTNMGMDNTVFKVDTCTLGITMDKQIRSEKNQNGKQRIKI